MSATNPALPAGPQNPDPRDYTNYGDCALKLPSDWSRTRMSGAASFILTTVGHERGIADAFLTSNPGQSHQFTWCSPEDQNNVSMLRTNHYDFCMRTEWTKNANLWMIDGEGYIVHNGQRLMARERKYYDADKEQADAEIERRDSKVSREDAQIEARVASQGAILEDENGRQLRPLKR